MVVHAGVRLIKGYMLVSACGQGESADDAARLSPEELLAEALRAFKQDADNAAQRASPSQSLSLKLPADNPDIEAQPQPPQVSQPPQQLLQQSASLPDLSKGATSEQSPAGESPSPATSEPGPGPQEHQAWGVLRPTPQRIGMCLDHHPLASCSANTPLDAVHLNELPHAPTKVHAWPSTSGNSLRTVQAAKRLSCCVASTAMQALPSCMALTPSVACSGLGEINTGSLPLSPTSSLRPTSSLKNLGGASPISTSGPQRTGLWPTILPIHSVHLRQSSGPCSRCDRLCHCCDDGHKRHRLGIQ